MAPGPRRLPPVPSCASGSAISREWSEFGRRYRRELKAHAADLDGLRAQARRRTVTLLYAAKDPQHNHALVLKAVLEGDVALTR